MEATKESKLAAQCRVAVNSAEKVHIELSGDLTARTISSVWKKCSYLLKTAKTQTFIIDTGGINSCDGSGIGLLSYLLDLAEQKKIHLEITALDIQIQQMLDRLTRSPVKENISPANPLNAVESFGKLMVDLAEDIYEQISFLGQILVTSGRLIMRPWKFRWHDFFHNAEYAGVRAFGIVSLLGFLFGLIMSFSSAMPLRQFGVEIYVSDLVAYALVRVLGPIITAIIVAGRTGSAYAAELGAMKINHEMDALKMMNLDPVAFLVMPRVLATTLMTPLLVVAANVWGLIGSAIVILSLGYPLVTYTSHIQSILTVPDVMVGLFKSIVYGTMVGMVGCLRGMQTKIGAGAVGVSTTRAVVTAIVLLVLFEGIFSVLFYFLDI